MLITDIVLFLLCGLSDCRIRKAAATHTIIPGGCTPVLQLQMSVSKSLIWQSLVNYTPFEGGNSVLGCCATENIDYGII